jgi:hypothetical protein
VKYPVQTSTHEQDHVGAAESGGPCRCYAVRVIVSECAFSHGRGKEREIAALYKLCKDTGRTAATSVGSAFANDDEGRLGASEKRHRGINIFFGAKLDAGFRAHLGLCDFGGVDYYTHDICRDIEMDGARTAVDRRTNGLLNKEGDTVSLIDESTILGGRSDVVEPAP